MSYRIREARKAAQITQADLASKLGINRATLSKYESGSIEPSISQLKKIAHALQIENWTDLVDSDKAAQMVIDHVKENLRKHTSVDPSIQSPDLGVKILSEDGKTFERIENVVHRVGPGVFFSAYQELDDFLSGLGTLEDRLWYAFDILNDEGKQKAVERIEELTEIPKYRLKPEDK